MSEPAAVPNASPAMILESRRSESSQPVSTEGMRERLLIDELNHRVKNTLAVVQSIAMQTLRDDQPGPVAREAFIARLMALADAHDVLAAESWEGAGLEQVLAKAIGVDEQDGRGGRVSLTGPVVRLTPKAAMALSMAAHELATNAARHGALSGTSGRVEVDWSVTERDGGDRLALTWTERGGPAIAAPSRKGFGSRLIERGLGGELDGSAGLEFPPEGAVCRVDAPMSAVAVRA